MLALLLLNLLTLIVRPDVGFAPTRVMVTVMFDQPDARYLQLAVDGENYFSSSTIPLETEKSPIRREFRRVLPGDYEVVVQFLSAEGKLLARKTQPLHLEGRE